MSMTTKCGAIGCTHRGFGGFCNLAGSVYLDSDGRCEHIDIPETDESDEEAEDST